MDVKRFNERRAEQERAKARSAASDETRQHHNILADIFAARAAARDSSSRTPDR